MSNIPEGFKKVVFAADCPPCECCGEPACLSCMLHYSDCDCPGPTQDEMEYQEIDGVLYAKEAPDD